MNQLLEDMLRMYVKEQPSKWEDYLHLVEFAYNNHYQASARYSPFEILYGPELLKEMELIVNELKRSSR